MNESLSCGLLWRTGVNGCDSLPPSPLNDGNRKVLVWLTATESVERWQQKGPGVTPSPLKDGNRKVMEKVYLIWKDGWRERMRIAGSERDLYINIYACTTSHYFVLWGKALHQVHNNNGECRPAFMYTYIYYTVELAKLSVEINISTVNSIVWLYLH
jgi:hypothetical protein